VNENLPVTLAAAILLRLGRVLVGKARLCKELGRPQLAGRDDPLGGSLVVAGVELLRTGHWE
jgi:uncharacterized membrane protein YgdD (TMEM256/DUF423 family)